MLRKNCNPNPWNPNPNLKLQIRIPNNLWIKLRISDCHPWFSELLQIIELQDDEVEGKESEDSEGEDSAVEAGSDDEAEGSEEEDDEAGSGDEAEGSEEEGAGSDVEADSGDSDVEADSGDSDVEADSGDDDEEAGDMDSGINIIHKLHEGGGVKLTFVWRVLVKQKGGGNLRIFWGLGILLLAIFAFLTQYQVKFFYGN